MVQEVSRGLMIPVCAESGGVSWIAVTMSDEVLERWSCVGLLCSYSSVSLRRRELMLEQCEHYFDSLLLKLRFY